MGALAAGPPKTDPNRGADAMHRQPDCSGQKFLFLSTTIRILRYKKGQAAEVGTRDVHAAQHIISQAPTHAKGRPEDIIKGPKTPGRIFFKKG